MISKLGIRSAVVSALLALANVSVSAQVFCGAIVTSDAVMVTDMLCPFDDPAIIVQGSATLDMNGHRLFGGQTNVGIELTGKGATLKNGAVIDFAVGVHVGGSGGHNVDQVVSRVNASHGFVIASPDNHVEHSVSYLNDGIGFFVFSFQFPDSPTGFANGNVLLDNAAVFNASNGFWLGGDDGSYKRNVASENNETGFVVDGKNNVLLRNNTQGNNGNGFEVSGSENQLFENTSVNDFDIAFLLPEKKDSKSKLVGNVAIAGEVGFQGGTTLVDNASVGNFDGGIALSAAGAKVTGNAVVGVEGMAIVATGAGSELSKNRMAGNEVGMVIGFAQGMTMSSNVALANDLDLVDLSASCSGHTWSQNVFSTATSACIK